MIVAVVDGEETDAVEVEGLRGGRWVRHARKARIMRSTGIVIPFEVAKVPVVIAQSVQEGTR